jgi:NADH dehydrogenase [ubiquinone] 1 alpha subcomplex assembly factor 7
MSAPVTPLETIIKETIRSRGADGYMDMAEYMGLCLGHPEHGYYMTRDPFGREGDFTTAPEISQMFGEMIGAWLADTWMKMGSPSSVVLLECGAGRGTLMADALRATKQVAGFHEAVQLHLMEISPVLKAAQKSALQGYDATWHSDAESLPTDSPLLILGNEFLDALPVRQFVFSDTGWLEKVIKIDVNDTIRLHEIKAGNGVEALIPPMLIPPKAGDHLEVSLELNDFVNKITNIVLKQGGNSLFIDYGFNHSVAGDTLQAVKNHGYCDVLETPGEVDLTAHVNFASLSQQIMEKNLTVHGPVSQGEFLKRLGIEVRADNLSRNATDKQRVEITTALKRLTGEKTKDGEMGALFKVIAFSSDPTTNLEGF